MSTDNKMPFYRRKEFYGACIVSITPTLLLCPSHTTAFKIGISLNALAGGLLTYFGVVKGYKSDNLWKPLDNAIDNNLPEGLRRK